MRDVIESPDPYRIRVARADELARLKEIEDEAGELFEGLGLNDETLDSSFATEQRRRLVALGQVWVACTADDVAVGAVAASVRDGAVYVEELDVVPMHGRRGIGTRLLAHVCAWGMSQGLRAVTLSTFGDVAWNGRFYRSQGFRDLDPSEWTPSMHSIRDDEGRQGLVIEARVFMRRELS